MEYRDETAARLKDRLLVAVPAVREVYAAHLAKHGDFDYYHFFAELAGWVNAQFSDGREKGATSGPWLEVLDFLEAEYSYSEPRIDEFVECRDVSGLIGYFGAFIPDPDEPGGEIREYFGPEMSTLTLPPIPQTRIDAGQQLADRMLQAVPETEPVYRSHMDSMGYASILLFGQELMSWTVDRFVESQRRGETIGPWRDLIDFFEAEYAEAERRYEVDEMARLTEEYVGKFVDSLPEPGQPGEELVNYFGPHLRGAIVP